MYPVSLSTCEGEMGIAFSRKAESNNARTSLSRAIPHDGPAGLSPAARSTLSSNKFELSALSSQLSVGSLMADG